MKNKKQETYWVVPGGSPGEVGNCQRCGAALRMQMPAPVDDVITKMREFAEAHSLCQAGLWFPSTPKNPKEWAEGRDTGTSSLTIYCALTGEAHPHGRRDVPHDPGDFGRCYRLVRLFPEWLPRLREVPAYCPSWAPFVANWPALCEMYERAEWKRLYQTIQALRSRSEEKA